jgi:transglutaminase/protease-like cytokinesis protein 3
MTYNKSLTTIKTENHKSTMIFSKCSKLIFLVVFLFTNSFLLIAQTDFTKVDNFAKGYKTKTTDVSKLATDLTAPFDNDLDKVRSIFIWMTNNIEYDYKEYLANRKKGKGGTTTTETVTLKAKSKEEMAEKQRKLKEEWLKKAADDSIANIATVLKRRKGVCQDYTELFIALCKAVNIKAGIIEGSIKYPTGQIIENDHTWNWFEINKKTYLTDVTWASGNVDFGSGKFTKFYKEHYFRTAPELFVMNHFPNESKWQLLSKPVSKEAFKDQPAIGDGFLKFKVKSYSPEKWILKNKQLAVSMVFGSKPASIAFTNNGQVYQEVKEVNDNFKTTLTLKGNEIGIWGDNEFIMSYKLK